MKKPFIHRLLLVVIPAIIFLSCNKEKNEDIRRFYGSWKTSYGDTITFSRSSDKNMLNYNSMNASATRVNQEYSYENNKLGLKDGLNGPGNYHFFESFKWIQEGSVFEIQGMQWFLFLSSTLTYFTFTKIN